MAEADDEDDELDKTRSIARRENRRQLERRAPQPGVTTRFDDPDDFQPKRIRKGRMLLKPKKGTS